MDKEFYQWFNQSEWAGAGKDAAELAKAAWDAGIKAYQSYWRDIPSQNAESK